MMKFQTRIMLLTVAYIVFVTLNSYSQSKTTTPVKEHVRLVIENGDSSYVKYSSKLRHVVELNFTLNYHHNQGKPILTGALNNIAQREGFTFSHFTGASGGTSRGSLPDFTLDDLKQGQVIFANNISDFGRDALGEQRRNAIRNAIVEEGIGYFGNHASGDHFGNSSWSFYIDSLHPLSYYGSLQNDVAAPVYKWEKNKNHVVLDGILNTNTQLSAFNGKETPGVLMGTDSSGSPISLEGIPYRMMRNEWYQFQIDVRTEKPYSDNFIPLLFFDHRTLGNALPEANKFPGGNVHSWLQQIGKGWTAYFPSGHDQFDLSDTTENNRSFDGGTGDLERFFTNMLYFLAGYDSTKCSANLANCDGLALVDSNFQITEHIVEKLGVKGFSSPQSPHIINFPQYIQLTSKVAGRLEIITIQGQKMFSKNNVSNFQYSKKRLVKGLYFLKFVMAGKSPILQKFTVL